MTSEEIDAEAKRLRALLWAAWMELNAIRARDGVPYTHMGWKASVDEGYFSTLTDALAEELGLDCQPWPNKKWLNQDGSLPFLVERAPLEK